MKLLSLLETLALTCPNFTVECHVVHTNQPIRVALFDLDFDCQNFNA
jgi:hypothetical protein